MGTLYRLLQHSKTIARAPMCQIFHEGEVPASLRNMKSAKDQDEWGIEGKDANYLDQLCGLLEQMKPSDRRVSTTLRHMLTEFSEFFHVSWTGLLIHAWVGTAGGLGALRTKRSG
jgi:hypothetical protein